MPWSSSGAIGETERGCLYLNVSEKADRAQFSKADGPSSGAKPTTSYLDLKEYHKQ